MPSEIVIEARRLKRVFKTNGNEQIVINDLDCTIYSKEVVAIMGASGVGKTTLIHLLSTLDRPSGGSVYLFGKDASKMSDRELARLRNEKLGFVFQMHHLMGEFSALENVCMPYLIAGTPRREAEKEAIKLFQLLGLSDKITMPVKRLSGGEQQRVAIARAMVKNPSVLFADEPTGNLDEAATDTVGKMFKEINERFSTTIVFVTHNPRLAQVATRVLTLTKGRLEETKHGSLEYIGV